MTENAVPTRTVRPSPRRAPWIVSASDAIAAVSAVKPTPSKWTSLLNMTCRCPNARCKTNGTSAARVPSARTGPTCRVELRRIPRTKGPGSGPCLPPTGDVSRPSGDLRKQELPDPADLVEAQLRVQLFRPVVAVCDQESEVMARCTRGRQRTHHGRPGEAAVPEPLERQHVFDLADSGFVVQLAVASDLAVDAAREEACGDRVGHQ